MRLLKHLPFSNLAMCLVITLCSSSQSCASTVTVGYLQLQGGIGGLYTKDYPENSDPYDQVSLRQGMAYRVSAGHLWSHKIFNYGGELGFTGFPKNSYSFNFPSLPASGIENYKGNTVDLLGVLKLNLNSMVHRDVCLFGKGGIAAIGQTFNGQSAAFDTVFAVNKTVWQVQPEVAAGIGYLFGKDMDINLSYHHVFAGQSDPGADSTVAIGRLTQPSTVGLLLAGIAYHFA